MTMIVRDLGVTVRRLREARGWSQEQLAEHAALNRSYVGEIERGSVIASVVTVEKLARALDASIAALLCTAPSVASDDTIAAAASPLSVEAAASSAPAIATTQNVPA
ncbi:helix-turn-helix domain-containing protein [Paraburkholderia flava]|uniref:helix-turn-helix domain-containing protein n=1 Tax=Paraburkholderia flava TaxID=2547393 RepID=UPI001414D83A|nr:helix-turn-helix transcriptional regulator [Paraburkholderia flava]